MSQSRESSVQRRKLRDEIRRLADIAVFGTLSESYRTCGRAGCHCQHGGPKPGPHLNISYHGEQGKTTGYYVPQEAEPATREGVAAWQKLQACLRKLAELNQERNLRHNEAKLELDFGLDRLGVPAVQPGSTSQHESRKQLRETLDGLENRVLLRLAKACQS